MLECYNETEVVVKRLNNVTTMCANKVMKTRVYQLRRHASMGGGGGTMSCRWAVDSVHPNTQLQPTARIMISVYRLNKTYRWNCCGQVWMETKTVLDQLTTKGIKIATHLPGVIA